MPNSYQTPIVYQHISAQKQEQQKQRRSLAKDQPPQASPAATGHDIAKTPTPITSSSSRQLNPLVSAPPLAAQQRTLAMSHSNTTACGNGGFDHQNATTHLIRRQSVAGDAKHLPLRKRLAPLPKSQPKSLSEQPHHARQTSTLHERPTSSSSGTEDKSMQPSLAAQPPTQIPDTTTLPIPCTIKKPLKKVQHWITKGKMAGPTIDDRRPGDNLASTEVQFTTAAQRPSWVEDDRPVMEKRRPLKALEPQPNQVLDNSISRQARILAGKNEVPGHSERGDRRNSTDASSEAGYSETLYCICRKPYDAPRFMIACDRCDQWFHGECIGISEREGEFIDHYFCDDCSKATGKMTSWKPKCANPACQKAARMGSHQQGHISKYCSNVCGMQVARARLELAEKRRRAINPDATVPMLTELAMKRERDGLLNSFTDKQDRQRIREIRTERRSIKAEISTLDRRLSFVRALLWRLEPEQDLCGFDSRICWQDYVWKRVRSVIQDDNDDESNRIRIEFTEDADLSDAQLRFSVCRLNRKDCLIHAGWEDIKRVELEQERCVLLDRLENLLTEKSRILERLKKRRQGSRSIEWLMNATISHT